MRTAREMLSHKLLVNAEALNLHKRPANEEQAVTACALRDLSIAVSMLLDRA